MATLFESSVGAAVAGSPILRDDWRTAILAATDASPSADAAIAAARTLARGERFDVISVVSDNFSTDRPSHGRDGREPFGVPGASAPERRRCAVAAQLQRVLGEDGDVRIQITHGYPPQAIAQYACSSDASLLVTTIGDSRVLQRLLGNEFTLRMARMTHTPMLAVGAGSVVPPRRVLVGVDFSVAALRAAALAMAAAPEGELLLAHVETPAGRSASVGAIQRLAEGMQAHFRGRIIPLELTGDAATEILALATARGVDAIAVGTHGDGLVAPGMLGPVATRVIRCSPCSVLVAPITVGHSPAGLHPSPDGRLAPARRV